jgi:hypothetical protein
MAKIAQLQSENDALKLQLSRLQRILQMQKQLLESRDNMAANPAIPPDARKFEFNGAPVYLIPLQQSKTDTALPTLKCCQTPGAPLGTRF